MSYIEIFPKSEDAYKIFADKSEKFGILIFEKTRNIFDIPDYDIIVELHQCSTAKFISPKRNLIISPDIVIKISTSDHDLQLKFSELCSELIKSWNEEFGSSLTLEIWIGLIDSWASNINYS